MVLLYYNDTYVSIEDVKFLHKNHNFFAQY